MQEGTQGASRVDVSWIEGGLGKAGTGRSLGFEEVLGSSLLEDLLTQQKAGSQRREIEQLKKRYERQIKTLEADMAEREASFLMEIDELRAVHSQAMKTVNE